MDGWVGVELSVTRGCGAMVTTYVCNLQITVGGIFQDITILKKQTPHGARHRGGTELPGCLRGRPGAFR